MLYLPRNTTKAICMEMPNPDGSMRWWLCALAYGHEEDICFSCWGNHTELSLDYTAQGKTLCYDFASQDLFRHKIEEKLAKGYQTISNYDGYFWSKPLIQITNEKKGTSEGELWLGGKSSTVLLQLYSCNGVARIDHYESKYGRFFSHPNWQTLYPTVKAAHAAIEAVRNRYVAQEYSVRQDTINWKQIDIIDLIAMSNLAPSGIAWDF